MKLALALLASIASMLCAVAAPEVGVVSPERDRIMAALDGMIFDKIELKNATIDEATRLLTKESRQSDPQHQGIRFVVRASSPRPPASITMDVQNASLKTVLKQIQQQTGYAYTVGDKAVSMWYDNGEGLTRRTFTVPNGFFEITAGPSPYDVKPQLTAKGIHFPVGMSAQYQPDQRQLIVTASPDQLEDIDDLLFHFSQQRGKGP